MPKSWIVVVVVLVVLSAGTSQAEDACLEFRNKVTGKTFVAKEPLYDTKVSLDGIVRLERDKEEIRKGSKFEVLKVSCGGKNVELTLRESSVYKADKVEVYFLYRKSVRHGEEALKNLEKIMSYVFAEPEDESED
jgi:hypothetical protein